MEEKQIEEFHSTPIDLAQRLIEEKKRHEEARTALIADLLKQRNDIDAALKELGAGRERRRSKPGRPVGSKNKPKPEVAA